MNNHDAGDGRSILWVLTGSRAYGLDGPESDFDYHGVYIAPTSRLLSLGPKVRDSVRTQGDEAESTAWEIAHFLNLAVQSNPTIIEVMVAPLVASRPPHPRGLELRALLPHVLARKRVFDAFRGYAANQRTRMFEPAGGVQATDRMIKAAIAYLRTLWHGITLLQNGTYDTRIQDEAFRQELLTIRRATRPDFGHVVNIAMDLEERITQAYAESTLPAQPNLDAVNEYLLSVRREFWDA